MSHESQLLTISTKEFLFCDNCGFAQPFDQGRVTKHDDPRSGKACKSNFLQSFYLGHEFKTDVIQLRFPGKLASCACGESDCLGALESTAAAVLSAAARTLGISSSDLNSSVQSFNSSLNYINIFDTTPGGIGLTVSISERISEILELATRIVNDCRNCREDSSCYACLRNYSNQRRHDHLIRSLARETILSLMS